VFPFIVNEILLVLILSLMQGGHGLRALAITTAANGKLNPKESMAFSRHSSMSAQKNYQRQNGTSEMAKFRALGVIGSRKRAAK
jgi:hypothetical protein